MCLGVEQERNQIFVRRRDILLLSLATANTGTPVTTVRKMRRRIFFPVHFYSESESYYLSDILYWLCWNRNLKDKNRVSCSGTNTWFLFCSTPKVCCFLLPGCNKLYKCGNQKISKRCVSVAEAAQQRRCTKGQGLLRKEGPLTYAIL